WMERGCSVREYMACSVTFCYTCTLGILQNHCGSKQNPNHAKYQQCEQGHQQYRHTFTSLLL
ncbi:MAG: hypothetical protein WB566_11415, partial [Terriglobales bacterium]